MARTMTMAEANQIAQKRIEELKQAIKDFLDSDPYYSCNVKELKALQAVLEGQDV